jgi:AraC-like DNA-binding protein
MPLYMDRHDVSPAVTAEHIAILHQKDLKVQQKFGCRGLTYWFDDQRKTAFCLIEAPDMKSIEKMHKHAHGEVPHTIIEVDPGIVESFLGRIADPEKAQNTELNIINDPAFRTIMIISIDRLASPVAGSASLKTTLKNFNKGVLKILNAYDGQVVNQTDFNWLASFKSVTHAVQAAFQIRSIYKELSKLKAKEKISLKIGLSAGVPVTKKQLIFEDTIKAAERMCAILLGTIIISSEVKDLYKSENADAFIQGKDVLSLTPADEKFITLLMDYTDSAWNTTDLKADDFCKPTGSSKSQLYRKMIVLTGKSPNTFINDFRLKEALKLLRKNAGNVSEIAFETGFSSPSYFAKCFQKKYGHTPSEYLLGQEVG